jgi:exodeoxyribonuclease III
MKLATWNVNSLKVRLPQVLDWLQAQNPDALCLQETKTTDEGFPFADLEQAGYHAIHNGQKTYNGVAILARTAPTGCRDRHSRLRRRTTARARRYGWRSAYRRICTW